MTLDNGVVFKNPQADDCLLFMDATSMDDLIAKLPKIAKAPCTYACTKGGCTHARTKGCYMNACIHNSVEVRVTGRLASYYPTCRIGSRLFVWLLFPVLEPTHIYTHVCTHGLTHGYACLYIATLSNISKVSTRHVSGDSGARL